MRRHRCLGSIFLHRRQRITEYVANTAISTSVDSTRYSSCCCVTSTSFLQYVCCHQHRQQDATQTTPIHTLAEAVLKRLHLLAKNRQDKAQETLQTRGIGLDFHGRVFRGYAAHTDLDCREIFSTCTAVRSGGEAVGQKTGLYCFAVVHQ